MAAGATGTFSGAVEVSGELSFSFSGRVYADTGVGATVEIFPGTGFNGGRTVVTGGARRFGGYDIAGGGFGTERFSLVFQDVPFTFGQRIDLGLSMTMVAGIDITDAGATGRADAAYGQRPGKPHRCTPARVDNAVRACTERIQRGWTS